MLIHLGESASSGDGKYEVQRIEKNYNFQQYEKRNNGCQNDTWSSCPASVGGGCCPSNFECGTASCFEATSACGAVGYFSCPATAGLGSCCPIGFICDTNGIHCKLPVVPSAACPASYISCAASFGGGCCQSSRVCGSGICYDAIPSTAVGSEKMTFTSNGHAITTIVTSGLPSTFLGSATVAPVPQLIPSTVVKQTAIYSSSSSIGTLSSTSASPLAPSTINAPPSNQPDTAVKAGIGVGAAVGSAIIVSALGYFLLSRYRRKKLNTDKLVGHDHPEGNSNGPYGYVFPKPELEAIGTQRFELGDDPPKRELEDTDRRLPELSTLERAGELVDENSCQLHELEVAESRATS